MRIALHRAHQWPHPRQVPKTSLLRARATVSVDNPLHPLRHVEKSAVIVDGNFFAFDQACHLAIGVHAGFERLMVVDDLLREAYLLVWP